MTQEELSGYIKSVHTRLRQHCLKGVFSLYFDCWLYLFILQRCLVVDYLHSFESFYTVFWTAFERFWCLFPLGAHPDEVWERHKVDKETLQKYAKSMKQLATECWEKDEARGKSGVCFGHKITLYRSAWV